MTPCKEKGYKVGDEFVVSNPRAPKVHRKGVKVRLCEDDGTSAPYFEAVFKKDRDGTPKWVFDLGEVSPISEHGIIPRTNGQPYATESSARQQLAAKGLQGTHEVVSHEGGYALVPISRDDNPITLQPGDHVSTEGMTEDQYHAVARAFGNAGCPRFDRSKSRGNGSYLEWWDGELVSTSSLSPGGRHLTIDQVLGATNAKPENGEDSHCPQDIRTIVNVNLHTKGDAQALRDAFDNLKSGCGDFPTMTATQLDTVEDPITTLKQARQARDEAEQAYQEALEEAREFIGDGFELTEVGADGPLVDGEDMTDPANWREGDVVEVVDKVEDSHLFSHGELVTIRNARAINMGEPAPRCTNQAGASWWVLADNLRFHHRPA